MESNHSNDELPNHFTDEELIEIIDSSPFILSLSTKSRRYDLTCGLVLLCRTGLNRLIKRSKFRRRKIVSDINHQDEEEDDNIKLLYKLVTYYSKSIDISIWTIDNIYIAGEELHTKTKLLSPKLQKVLYKQYLILSNTDINSDDFMINKSKQQILYFNRDFLLQVSEYHNSLRRRDGTFVMNESNDKMDYLSKFDRDTCKKCNQRRAVYCGECKGLRMENTSHLLPKRVRLPFDVLIVLHFAENLRTCTGVHCAALGGEGEVEFAYWPRGLYNTGESGLLTREFVASLNSDRDIILYPSADAIDSSLFHWMSKIEESTNQPIINDKSHRWRLVVLEASWQHGKTMAQQIADYRNDHNPPLPPLKYVSLSSLHGQYWKFHELGDTAVSTMEAIAHAAKCAWNYMKQDEQEINNKYEDLLFLFKLQKYRVLNRISNQDGGNLPRSIFVDGGSDVWGNLTKCLNDEN